MSVGVNLQGNFPISRQRELAREAEAAGVDSLWTNDSLARDPFLLCQAWADATARLEVGIGVAQIATRTPAQLAKAAATLQESSGGRLLLGLGVSQPFAMEQWHGVSVRKPLATARDALAILRASFAGGPTDHRGAALSSVGFRLDMEPLPPPPPLYLGAMKPRMLALAGAEADGVLLSWESCDGVHRAVETARRAAEKAGRPAPRVAGYVRVAVAADAAAARAALAREIADYWRYYAGHFAGQGLEDEVARGDEVFRLGGAAALAAALDDRILDALGWHGTADDGLPAVLDRYREAGLDRVVAYLVPVGDPEESFRLLLQSLA